MASQVLLAGDELGVFDYLGRGTARTAKEVAAAFRLDPGATERFLRASVALGLCVAASEQRFEVPAPVRPYLARDGAHYAGAWLTHIRTITAHTFGKLTNCLHSGEPQLKAILGADGEELFAALYADPERLADFASSMWSLGFSASQELVEDGVLEGERLLVDLGGGSGSFAVAAALQHPQLRAAVLDLPALGPSCQRMLELYGVASRVSFLSSDFFRDPLPSADVYALGYILSDWSHEKGTDLLRRAVRALRPGGALLVLERLLDSDGCGPLSASLMDLCMLLETEGRHRTAAEYLEWLKEVGLVDCRIRRSSRDKHMIIGVKRGES